MKRWLTIALALALSLTACSQTTQTPPTSAPIETPAATKTPVPSETPAAVETPAPTSTPPAFLPLDDSLYLSFSSGAGAWDTELFLAPDGSFSGMYHDTDAGVSGPDYDFTRYICNFAGNFSEIRDNGDGSWTMTLEQVSVQPTPADEWIVSETYGDQAVRVRYVSAEPYGLETGKDFILYSPNTPVEGLDEEFLLWWPGRYKNPTPTTLEQFGLWNKAANYGFFGS